MLIWAPGIKVNPAACPGESFCPLSLFLPRGWMPALLYPHSRTPSGKLIRTNWNCNSIDPIIFSPYSSALILAYTISSLDFMLVIHSPLQLFPICLPLSSPSYLLAKLQLWIHQTLTFLNLYPNSKKNSLKQLFNKTDCFYFEFIIIDLKCIVVLLQTQFFSFSG